MSGPIIRTRWWDVVMLVAAVTLFALAWRNVRTFETRSPKCGGKDSEHCGCSAVSCQEPCVDCCPTVPCPVDGCTR